MADTSKIKISPPEQWVDLYGNYLYRYALSRLRNVEQSENMVQETFLAALKSKDDFKGNSNEKTWLTGILKHKIIDSIREKYRKISSVNLKSDEQAIDNCFNKYGDPKRKPFNWEENPREILKNKEFWETVENCLNKLPKTTAEIFALREIDNLESKQICKLLGITTTNLWVIIHRARLQLRDCLEKNWFKE